jgi:hypothetical protein
MSKSKSEIEKRKCRVQGCERPVPISLLTRHEYICSSHREIQYRKSRPVSRARLFQRLDARKRNIGYSLSRRHWYYLNYFTLYWKNKGKQSYQLQIDRIDNSKNYSDYNIQVVDGLYNRKKGKGKDLLS